jgi:hypothetical protein
VCSGVSELARWLVSGAGLYVALGSLFAPWFLWRGVDQVDPHAHGASLGFRLVIAPGVVIFWPFLLWRWATGQTELPAEANAHRRAVGRPATTRRPEP